MPISLDSAILFLRIYCIKSHICEMAYTNLIVAELSAVVKILKT